MALIVRAFVTREIPASSYDEAWDAIDAAAPNAYAPTAMAVAWMRLHWLAISPTKPATVIVANVANVANVNASEMSRSAGILRGMGVEKSTLIVKTTENNEKYGQNDDETHENDRDASFDDPERRGIPKAHFDDSKGFKALEAVDIVDLARETNDETPIFERVSSDEPNPSDEPDNRPWARDWMPRLIGPYLDAGGIMNEACRVVGLSNETVRRWYHKDVRFKAAIDAADKVVDDTIRTVIRNRAIEGVEEPVFGRLAGQDAGDGQVGVIRKFDHKLLMRYAEVRLPEWNRKVADTTVNVNTSATATAAAASVAVCPPEKVLELQARRIRQLQRALDRSSKQKDATTVRT